MSSNLRNSTLAIIILVSPPAEDMIKVVSKFNFPNHEILKELFPFHSHNMISAVMMIERSGQILWISCNIDVLAGCRIWQATRHSLVRHVTFECSWRSQIIGSDCGTTISRLYPRHSITDLLSIVFPAIMDEMNYVLCPCGTCLGIGRYPNVIISKSETFQLVQSLCLTNLGTTSPLRRQLHCAMQL